MEIRDHIEKWVAQLKLFIKNIEDSFERFNSRHPVVPKLIKGALWVVTIIFIAVAAFVMYIYAGGYDRMPSKAELKEIENDLASEIYSSDSVILGRYFIQNRTTIEYEDVSSSVIKALVATEDVRFYEHEGIDYKSLFRVFFKTIIGQDESSGGGSTITQQLAKNLYPRRDYGLLSLPINKVQEMIIASRLEDVYDKDEIMTLYLNTISFGENIYGVETATRRFFNKPPKETTLEEAAVLVGMLKATTLYNPRFYPVNSRQRRNVVIDQMEKYKFITSADADSLRALPISLNYTSYSHNEGMAPYFREHLRQQLDEWARNHKKPDGTPYNVYRDGLKIYTTIDYKMQRYAEESLKEHMMELQNTFDKHWSYKKPWDKDKKILRQAMWGSEKYRILKEEGLSDADIEKRMNEANPMTIYKHEGEVAKIMSTLDSIKHYEMFLNSGFMVMDPKSGYIKAWVGGIDYKYFKFDNVLAERQVGSTFKPIVYATAIESGIEPCKHYPNYRKVYHEYDDWSPKNADDKYGGNYSLQAALTNSVNVVSVRLIMETGINKVIKTAQEMGISAELPPYPSIALGAADISLYDMVASYTTFANRGYYTEPVGLLRIEDRYGNVLEDFSTQNTRRKVYSQETTDIIVKFMQQVVDEGTGQRLRWKYKLKNDIAGKTGTTQSHADGWFIGYNPSLVAGVRVGAANPAIHFRSMNFGQGSYMALPIWGKFMQKLSEDSTYNHITNDTFPSLSEYIQERLDCQPIEYYSSPDDSERPFWQFLWELEREDDSSQQRSRDDNSNNSDGNKRSLEERINDIFSKKNNDT